MNSFILVGSLVLLGTGAAVAQQPPNPFKHAPQPTAPAITVADLKSRVYIFADDSMLGREAGTPGHLRAVEYIARELKRLGLEPAGDQGTFFQDFGLETIGPEVKVSVGGEALVQGTDFLAFPFVGLPAIGAPFNAEQTPVVFGGKLGTRSFVAAGQLRDLDILVTDRRLDERAARALGRRGVQVITA